MKPGPPSKPLPAQGGGSRKRTPSSSFDPAAGLEYLSPLETDMDLDLLAYWKLKESTWPKLAKMAKQYLAAPFSSAGVERVFSAAGKMHDDLRKSAKDSTLEHSLFAAFNCD